MNISNKDLEELGYDFIAHKGIISGSDVKYERRAYQIGVLDGIKMEENHKMGFEEMLSIYENISALIFKRKSMASSIFNDDKQWNIFHSANHIVSVDILKENIKLELMPCAASTGYGCGVWGGLEISFSDFENDKRFETIVTDWKNSLLKNDIEKNKLEKGYEYKKYLELKELFGN